MYEQYVNRVKNRSKFSLICIPMLVVILSVLPIMGFWSIIVELVLGNIADSNNDLGLGSTIEMILTLFTTLFLMKQVSGFSWRDFGFLKEKFLKNYLLGATGGALSIFIVFLVNYLFKGTEVTNVVGISSLSAIFIAFIFFLFQGMYEEVLFRLYLMPHFSKALGNIFSILFTSFLFMLLHGLNNSMNPMSYLNLFLFGMVFAVIYYRTGNAWLIGAGHSLWNFFLGPILGSNVSGLIPQDSILLSTPVKGHFLLNGGTYGMEGSIVTSFIGLIIIAYFLFSKNTRIRE